MKLEFSKMHGLGNDFVVINAITQTVALSTEQVKFLADRHFGIGCDQLLLVERASDPKVDFKYRIFNSDGGEVEQCGNGARCFAIFVRKQGLTNKNHIKVETKRAIIELHVEEDERVTVDMGVPEFEPAEIPLRATARAIKYNLDANGQSVQFGAVSMGNPHAVMLVEDVQTAQVATLGPLVESHSLFPRRVNAGFLQVIDRGRANLRVYERGAGETLACGTGACAAMVLGRFWGLFDRKVEIHLPGGALTIQWEGEGQPVFMTGPASYVYEGVIAI